eukprot:10184207-Alexandrium_andersonii.AAC.1
MSASLVGSEMCIRDRVLFMSALTDLFLRRRQRMVDWLPVLRPQAGQQSFPTSYFVSHLGQVLSILAIRLSAS